MPLQIRERPPKKFNVVKPRSTEVQSQKRVAGSTKPETLQSMAKANRQSARDLGGRGGWKAPSEGRSNPQIADQMNKNYEDHFFKIPRGNNLNSHSAQKSFHRPIRGSDFFR